VRAFLATLCGLPLALEENTSPWQLGDEILEADAGLKSTSRIRGFILHPAVAIPNAAIDRPATLRVKNAQAWLGKSQRLGVTMVGYTDLRATKRTESYDNVDKCFISQGGRPRIPRYQVHRA
jgi:hypothetical protein